MMITNRGLPSVMGFHSQQDGCYLLFQITIQEVAYLNNMNYIDKWRLRLSDTVAGDDLQSVKIPLLSIFVCLYSTLALTLYVKDG